MQDSTTARQFVLLVVKPIFWLYFCTSTGPVVQWITCPALKRGNDRFHLRYELIFWSRSSMDRMTDSGSVGWAFESPRDHQKALRGAFFVNSICFLILLYSLLLSV
jgi:hypothetical protein